MGTRMLASHEPPCTRTSETRSLGHRRRHGSMLDIPRQPTMRVLRTRLASRCAPTGRACCSAVSQTLLRVTLGGGGGWGGCMGVVG